MESNQSSLFNCTITEEVMLSKLRDDEIVVIMVKTEGNGNVNDFTRGFATYAIQSLLAGYLECSRSMISEKVSIVCSGGCEGVMSPHATIFTKSTNSIEQILDE